jgi:hypothetical protein
MRTHWWLWAGTFLVGPLWAGEVAPPAGTIQEAFEQAQAAARAGDYAQAMQGYRATVQLASQKEALMPDEQYVVAVCHLYLAALTFDQVLQTGRLDAPRAQIAQAWRDLIWQRPAGSQETPADAGPATPPDPLTSVGHGQEIDLAAHLAPGKTTIVLFSSNVAPCHRWEAYLRQLVAGRQDLAGVRVVIDREGQAAPDFQSPLALQYKITQVPTLQIFGPDKKLQKEGPPAEEQVLQWLRERAQ